MNGQQFTEVRRSQSMPKLPSFPVGARKPFGPWMSPFLICPDHESRVDIRSRLLGFSWAENLFSFGVR
jgi:hypothetical protein